MPKNKRSLEDGYDYLKEIGTSLIPIYGTYKEVKNLIDNPSLENAGYASLSLLSEIPLFKGLKFLKMAKTIKEAPLITRTIKNGLNKKQKDLLYHLDYGDNIGAFSNKGAYIKNNKLIPGKSKSNDQLDYIWFNEGKPYSIGNKGKSFNRAIIMNKKDVPGLIRVRDSKIPIGQWNGNSGFVTKSEMVTPQEVPIQNAYIYNRKDIPLFGNFWLRTK